MAYLASLPAGAVLLDASRAHPQIARPLLDYDQALLSGASSLTLVFLDVWGQRATAPNLGVGGDVTPSMSVRPGISGSHPRRPV